MIYRLVTQGFHASGAHVRLSVDSDSSHSSMLAPRIALSSQLLLEFLHAIHYALFDGNVMHATQALDDIYNRAAYESYTDVLLVANGIKNLLHISRSGKCRHVDIWTNLCTKYIHMNVRSIEIYN